MSQYGTYTFSLFVFALAKCIFCFYFSWIRKRTDNKTCFFKITFAGLFLIINNYFSGVFKYWNASETTLRCTLAVTWNLCWLSDGARTMIKSKMELFKTIFDSFYSVTIATKSSILDVAGILDPTPITGIFAKDRWILINLKTIFPSYRNRSVNSNGKEDDCLLWEGTYWLQIARENIFALDKVLK